MININNLHLTFINQVQKARKEAESAIFQDFNNGLITSLELANLIIKLHEEEKEILKRLKQL